MISTADTSATPNSYTTTSSSKHNVPRLRHLKTLAEVRAAHETLDVYVVAIPQKAASAALTVLKSAGLDRSTALDLQHLRRFVKPDFLPDHIRALFPADGLPDGTAVLYICPAAQISPDDLALLLKDSSALPFLHSQPEPFIFTIPVPMFAPTTSEQAADWSRQYWPISYKNTNPYGPHPALVARAEAELNGPNGNAVFDKLALAERVARQTSDAGIGERAACVISARGQSGSIGDVVIAVAGDARWLGCEVGVDAGNVMCHAALRAIALVALKRLRVDGTAQPQHATMEPVAASTTMRGPFGDTPLSALEARCFNLDNLDPGGYLCAELEIYLTHEPCAMCAMAILHSRFARCVFARRMPLTGAMTADGEGLGLGLFWRPAELNWKLLCWEWEGEPQDEDIADKVSI